MYQIILTISELVSEILDIVCIDAGKQEVSYENFNLLSTVNEIYDHLLIIAENK